MNELAEQTGKGLLIHHWDTDGICSARLFLEKFSDKIIVNKTPTLGNYFLTDDELKDCQDFDFIIVADMSLPEENILYLAKDAVVYIFDHHLGKVIDQVFHYNPVIKGENPNNFPSASWIVNQYLKNEINLYAILGIIGDHEQKIKNNEIFYNKILEFCEANNLTFDSLLNMSYLIDSNYKTGDKKAVEQAPYYLLENPGSENILNHDEWINNVKNLDNEINEILSEPIETLEGIIFKKMNTKSNIISTITRKIAWNNNQATIVLNSGYFEHENQLYVRTIDQDMKPMIQKGKQYGFKCGGKKEVLGAILPKEKTNAFIEEIMTYLKK